MIKNLNQNEAQKQDEEPKKRQKTAETGADDLFITQNTPKGNQGIPEPSTNILNIPNSVQEVQKTQAQIDLTQQVTKMLDIPSEAPPVNQVVETIEKAMGGEIGTNNWPEQEFINDLFDKNGKILKYINITKGHAIPVRYRPINISENTKQLVFNASDGATLGLKDSQPTVTIASFLQLTDHLKYLFQTWIGMEYCTVADYFAYISELSEINGHAPFISVFKYDNQRRRDIHKLSTLGRKPNFGVRDLQLYQTCVADQMMKNMLTQVTPLPEKNDTENTIREKEVKDGKGGRRGGKKKPCRYVTLEKCPFGKKCRYSHKSQGN